MSSLDRAPERRRIRLSVLDLVHVRSGQSTSDAVAVSTSLARLAERVGYHRFWVAEHHNLPSSASTNPAVLIAILAAATDRIRIGSGATLLPNHAPLSLVEQFALLEAAFPGRIDLGVGRASGTDPLTRRLLGEGTASVETVMTLLDARGARFSVSGREHEVRATPEACSAPPIWLLGASEQSARTAAELGLSYVFGHHLGAPGAAAALSAYRASFRPSPTLAEPRTLLPVRVSVAASDEEAHRAALPWLLLMLGLHTGRPQSAMPTIEQAEIATARLPEQDCRTLHRLSASCIIGDAADARDQLRALADEYEVDELMIHPIAGSHDGEDPRTSSGQAGTLQLLAAGGALR